MQMRHGWRLAISLCALCLAGCATTAERASKDRILRDLLRQPLAAVSSEAELRAYGQSQQTLIAQLQQQRRRLRCERGETWLCDPPRSRESLDRIEVTGSRIKAVDVITNNQESGVDEGDIVKKTGRFVYILREGWLHVVDTGTPIGPRLDLIQSLKIADDPTGDTVWYDEILAYPGRLVLVGFNYGEDVAELLSYP